jgi:hypothetical protein
MHAEAIDQIADVVELVPERPKYGVALLVGQDFVNGRTMEIAVAQGAAGLKGQDYVIGVVDEEGLDGTLLVRFD